MFSLRWISALLVALLVLIACRDGSTHRRKKKKKDDAQPLEMAVRSYDFQGETDPVEAGFTRVTPADGYTEEAGHGFTVAPRSAIGSRRKVWTIFSRTVTVDEAIPPSVLSDATRDCVAHSSEYRFRCDVPAGDYDVTLWLGDVTSPRYQVRATVNGVAADALRMDVNHMRGRFDQAIIGSAVPVTVRVSAPDGFIEVVMGPHPDGASAIEWTYEQDEDPKNPPYTRTAVLVPAYSSACLQAIALHTAMDPPLVLNGTSLAIGSSPALPALRNAVGLVNAGDVKGARAGFEALAHDDLRAAEAAGLFWIAGHPALVDDEPELLAAAEALLLGVLADDPGDHPAADLLREVRICADAERFRRLYGYASSGAPSTENMGRSCALVANLPPHHPYHRKGQILWLRNRGGLDPRRVTVSWERAQWLARQLDAEWGDVNPYVHLYATDEWEPDGTRWSVIDWAAIAGDGPDWARSLMSNLNAWLDLFEWWSIHRQAPEGDIGGGWTDDVEIVPAFGLMAYVLEGASDISSTAVIRFADGIWNSDTIDRERGYQKQYADVEHTAEPTGNILHLHPLVRFGDPEGIERLLKSAKTFSEFFLTDGTSSPQGHRHFKGNHLSSTQIALNANHRADIPLCGRAVAPLSFLVWYAGNPGAEEPLENWVRAWCEDAARTDNRKPAGVFPNAVWTPDDSIGYPGTGDWWSGNTTYGQFSAFPGYQFYLYSLGGFFYLRTGEDVFRRPFDALRDYSLEWATARPPDLGDTPPVGQETLWVGGKLAETAGGAIVNVALGTGLDDWDLYLERFGKSYGKFILDPTDDSPIDDLAPLVDSLIERWPYRTTEGLMTDRILVPGWAEVISYYVGAEIFSVFFGMPVHAATWRNTTRLFAAAVTGATDETFDATLFLFSDGSRDVDLRLWRLELGADYLLEAGPANGLGLDPSSVDQSKAFRMEHLGDGVTFSLPGRTVYSLRVRQTTPPQGAPSALADLAVAPRDVAFDEAAGEVTVRVHNVGAADATAVVVRLLDAGSMEIGTETIASLEAPTDLVPRSATAVFSHVPADLPASVTVVVDPEGAVAEITEENNRAAARIGGEIADPPPPMLTGLSSTTVAAGGEVEITGKHFEDGIVALVSEAPTTLLSVDLSDAEHLTATVAASAPPGVYLVSVENPDGKRSNLVPLTATD
ncbi:MAG: CARDB domain-containing protein [Planctomycetota bacterium]